ncbi:MAG: DNA polymerase III subunit chi [Legionellales bacterium]|nr:DNA polymerase III subunit chi [Legionellales bacterium]
MMKQVDFYLLTTSDPYPFLIRLVKQLYQRNLKTLINLGTPAQYDYCDKLLWTHEDISFLPHNSIDEKTIAPILLAVNTPRTENCAVLINLAEEIPRCFNEFDRIAELVTNDENWKTISRAHYRFYQQQNYQLKMHK